MTSSARPKRPFAIAGVEYLAKRRMERAIEQLERVRFEQVEADRARTMICKGTERLIKIADADTAIDFLKQRIAAIKE